MCVLDFFLLFWFFFFFNDTATTEIYTRSIVGSVRCVQETGINAEYMGPVTILDQLLLIITPKLSESNLLTNFLTQALSKRKFPLLNVWKMIRNFSNQ
eukprot:TRINITY_DN19057_c0_g1_i3.p1 TRINITY_DN19057_c0_g1~~TRINITY_DN19057_c0_g1_i3.p1  ORF type:complete len:113 (-),score=26.53 TRINITY_DN19057_c0_g1_i3:132-425(-)